MSTGLGPLPAPEQSVQDALAGFDDIPLFMKSLPGDDSENPALSALQSLAYEGTPDEIAQNFKEQGNEYFKGKRYREAIGFYKQGIDAKPEDKTILEALSCNTAACNLELKNYGSVLKDCSKAISNNEKCSKAYYRSALALLALDRVNEALDCCERCLAFDSNNTGVKIVHERALKAKSLKEAREQAGRERIKKEQEEKATMAVAYRARNIIDVPKSDGSSNPYAPHWDPDDPTKSTLIVPVFFLYPQYATSDVITEFQENTPFTAHLEVMFPPNAPHPEWDQNKEYINGKLVIYAMTRRKRLLKVGKNMTLLDVCKAAKEKEGEKRDGLELKDGCLTFVVSPKGTDVEKKWVEEFKATRDKY
ncbi:Hsp70/Hsp90 co-chaperone cns1 [Leucoagaricus sp. SymC.cos]|nr:Hsp70/Hsp90 co-chaperone cns1 [Leucoagaricus sp. SymC.cos]